MLKIRDFILPQNVQKQWSTLAQQECEQIVSYVLRQERNFLYRNLESEIETKQAEQIVELSRRVRNGTPLQYVLGEAFFYNHNFIVSPAVLIPRPETELLVEAALKWAQSKKQKLKILDVGAGSGCIGISLLKELPQAHLTSVEISEEAIKVLETNLVYHDLLSRTEIIHGDFSEVANQKLFDLVVMNPPYIAIDDPEISPVVRRTEPPIALFAGDEGFQKIQMWIEKSLSMLKLDNGQCGLFCEIGYRQGDKAKKLMTSLNQVSNFKIVQDLSKKDRFIEAVICG